MMDTLKSRNPVFDNIKALGIILVIMGHVSHNVSLTNWIYSFHMPLFFFLSGVMFTFSREENFIKRKAQTLLIPYFTFGIVSFSYWLCLESRMRNVLVDELLVKHQIANLFGLELGGGDVNNNYLFNVVLWYIPCLFVVELLLWILRKNGLLVKIPKMCILAFTLLAWGYNEWIDIRLPWSADIAFSILPLVLVGFWIGKDFLEFCLQKDKVKDLFLFISVSIASCVAVIYGFNINLMGAHYPSFFPLLYIVPFFGIILVTVISKYIRWSFIEYIGRNSLIVMCVHEPVKRIVIKLISVVTGADMEWVRTDYLMILVATFITLVLTLPFVWGINRYMPFVLGRKKT